MDIRFRETLIINKPGDRLDRKRVTFTGWLSEGCFAYVEFYLPGSRKKEGLETIVFEAKYLSRI